jgi:CheY-like chemotaxis protein
MNQGPIILIDDDQDDLELIENGLKSLDVENEIISFENAIEAVDFFDKMQDQPFLILCDINMPLIDGLELRRRLFKNERLRVKTVPFLFLSTSGNHPSISNAYELSIQGYFIKPPDINDIKEMLRCIIDYWRVSSKPGKRN